MQIESGQILYDGEAFITEINDSRGLLESIYSKDFTLFSSPEVVIKGEDGFREHLESGDEFLLQEAIAKGHLQPATFDSLNNFQERYILYDTQKTAGVKIFDWLTGASKFKSATLVYESSHSQNGAIKVNDTAVSKNVTYGYAIRIILKLKNFEVNFEINKLPKIAASVELSINNLHVDYEISIKGLSGRSLTEITGHPGANTFDVTNYSKILSYIEKVKELIAAGKVQINPVILHH